FGDQKYLDQWPFLFQEIHECTLAGAGVAPWNLPTTRMKFSSGAIQVEAQNTTPSILIFYHFHGLRILKNGVIDYCEHHYSIAKKELQYIYVPYTQSIDCIAKFILDADMKKLITPEETKNHQLKTEKKRKKINFTNSGNLKTYTKL